jgi:hypothetical protein
MMGLANVTGAVADVFVTFNKEIYNGKSANQAASASIHKMSDAVKVATAGLMLFMPGGILIKGVVAALGLLASKLIDAGAAVSDQAEEVYKAYQQMAKTGATGAGAMQDVFDGLQKVGLGTEKFAAYIKLVTDNAQDLAQFGGTVNKGRKIFDSTMESFSENQRIQMELLVGGREEQAPEEGARRHRRQEEEEGGRARRRRRVGRRRVRGRRRQRGRVLAAAQLAGQPRRRRREPQLAQQRRDAGC